MLDIKKMLNKIIETDSSDTQITSTEGTISYRIVRGMVWIDAYGLSPTTSWKTVVTSANLPSEIIPDHYVRTQGFCNSNGKDSMTVVIADTGILISTAASSTAGSGAFTAIYPLP